MDISSKQKIAEENYKKLRTETQMEYNGDFNSPHYNEIPNKAVKATIATENTNYRSDYKEDFDKASKDFWQKNTQKGLSKYNGGSLTATFGRDIYTVAELLERVGKFIKESITNELIEKGFSTEDLQENFNSVDISLKLLANSIEKLDNDFNIEGMSAYLHGFINTYVSTIITKKIERDKGRVKENG